MWQEEYLDSLNGDNVYPQLGDGLNGTVGNAWTETLRSPLILGGSRNRT